MLSLGFETIHFLNNYIASKLYYLSGVMYGLNYAPILYCIDNYEGASKNSLDYLYSFCSGTLITSIVFLLIYCIVKKNQPIVYANIILPGFISGKSKDFIKLIFLFNIL